LINSARIPCRIKETIFILFYYLPFSRSSTFGHALVGTLTRDLFLTKGALNATRAILKWAGLDLHDRLQHSDSEVCRINLDGPSVAVKLFLGSAVTYLQSTFLPLHLL